MFNEVVLVGRLAKKPVLKESNSGTKLSVAVLEIEKGFKNGVGVYEYDFVSVILWKGLAESVNDCAEVGSIIGVKGRLQTRTYETSDSQRITTMEVVGERVQFLDKHLKHLV